MTLSNYQFAFNGVIIGVGGTYPVVVDAVDGLGGTSPLRIQDDNRGYIDGSYSGRDFYDGRTVTLDLLILGDSSHSAQYYYKALQDAWYPQQNAWYQDPTSTTQRANEVQLFQYQLTSDTGTKRLYGRFRGFTQMVITPDYAFGYIQVRANFYFPDPRYYDDTALSITSGVSPTLSNAGWAYSCPVITIASTTNTNGTISDGTTVMSFANMTTGQNLTIDLLQRIIYYNGNPARNIMTSASNGWLSVAPNISSVTWTSGVGSMAITARNAYI